MTEGIKQRKDDMLAVSYLFSKKEIVNLEFYEYKEG